MRTRLLVWAGAVATLLLTGLAGPAWAQMHTLTGTVYGGGSPLPGTTVEALENGTTTVVGGVTTDSAGHYVLDLADGIYDLRVTPPAGSGFGQTTVQDVAVNADVQQDVILITQLGAGNVSGTIRGLGGLPIAGAQVQFTSLSTGLLLGTTTTDTNGQYSLPAGGGVLVRAFSGPSSANAPASWSLSRSITSVSGLTTLDLVLPVVRVGGVATDSNGAPVAGVSITANSNSFDSNTSTSFSSSGFIQTDATGHYALLLISGTSGQVTAQPPAASGLAPLGASSLNLTNDTTENFVFAATTPVTGTIRGLGGLPIAGAQVQFTSLSTGLLLGTTTTDTNGQYSLPAGGGVLVRAFSGPSSANAPASWSLSRSITSVSGLTTLDLVLPVVRVGGVATDSNGAPVAGVSITANSNSFDSNTSTSFSSSGFIQTDATGRYALLLLKSTSARVTVQPPSQSGFSAIVISGVSLAGDVTQAIVLQHPDLVPPQIVAGPLVVHLSDTSVSISWTTDEPATSRVDFGLSAPTSTVTQFDLTTRHSVTLVGLDPLAIYSYRAGSIDASGNGPTFSTTGTFSTQAPPGDVTPPVLAAGPTVVSLNSTSALVQWTTDEPATSIVSYGLTSDFGTTVSGTAGQFIQSHSIALTGLAPQTTYSAQVTSADPDGNTTTSSTFSFTTAAVPDTTPPIISGTSILSKADTRVTIVWTTDEPATTGVSYNDGVHFQVVNDTTLTLTHQVTLSGLTPATTYTVTVSATDAAGNGPTLSAAGSVTTNSSADVTPPTLASAQVTSVTTSSAVISWTTNEAATSAVAYGQAPGTSDGLIASIDLVLGHSLTLTGLRDGTTYYVRPSSTDGSGNTAAGNVISFTTVPIFVDLPPSAPGPVTTPGSSTNALTYTVSWGASTDDVGVVGYDVLRNGTVLASVGPEITSITESAVPEGSYTYQISAKDTAGHATLSAAVTVVVDRTAPSLDMPGDIAQETTAMGLAVTFTATASDSVSGAVGVVCDSSSGSTFPVGKTTVHCTARDAAGNVAAATFVVTISNPPNIAQTPVGTGVSLAPIATLPDGSTSPVSVTFAQITATGQTTVTTASSGPPPPGGFKLGEPPIYYDVNTTATFTGAATLCFSWQEGQLKNENNARLLHFANGAWADVTVSVDTNANVICGSVTSLSPFAIMEASYQFMGFQAPLLADGSGSIKQANGGRSIPVKFQLRRAGQLTGAATASIAAFKMLDAATGQVDTTDLTADAGASNDNTGAFRYDPTSQTYIYNLSTSNWHTPATYQIVVTLSDGSVYSVNVSLR